MFRGVILAFIGVLSHYDTTGMSFFFGLEASITFTAYL